MPSKEKINAFGQLIDSMPPKSKIVKIIRNWHDNGFGDLSNSEKNYINSASGSGKTIIDEFGEVTLRYDNPTPEITLIARFLEVYSRRYVMLARKRKPLHICTECNKLYITSTHGPVPEMCSLMCRVKARADKETQTKTSK